MDWATFIFWLSIVWLTALSGDAVHYFCALMGSTFVRFGNLEWLCTEGMS
jgi:hypothetical protein